MPSASTRTNPNGRWSHSVVMEKEGPNDGLVSLKSAKWVGPDRSPRLLSLRRDA